MLAPILSTGIPGDFFTTASLGTLAGATGIVYVICGTIQKVFNYSPKWFALLISILISYAGALITTTQGDQVTKYFIALLNGFSIYMTATGTNQVVGRQLAEGIHQAGFRRAVHPIRQFNTKWW